MIPAKRLHPSELSIGDRVLVRPTDYETWEWFETNDLNHEGEYGRVNHTTADKFGGDKTVAVKVRLDCRCPGPAYCGDSFPAHSVFVLENDCVPT